MNQPSAGIKGCPPKSDSPAPCKSELPERYRVTRYTPCYLRARIKICRRRIRIDLSLLGRLTSKICSDASCKGRAHRAIFEECWTSSDAICAETEQSPAFMLYFATRILSWHRGVLLCWIIWRSGRTFNASWLSSRPNSTTILRN